MSGLGRGGDASGGAIHATGPGLDLLRDVQGNRALAGDGLFGSPDEYKRTVGRRRRRCLRRGYRRRAGAALDFQGGTIDDNDAHGGHGGFDTKHKASEGFGRGGVAWGGGVYGRNGSVSLDLGADAACTTTEANGGDAGTGETGSAYGGGLAGVVDAVRRRAARSPGIKRTGGGTNVTSAAPPTAAGCTRPAWARPWTSTAR